MHMHTHTMYMYRPSSILHSLSSELFGSVNTGINFDNYDDIPVETSGVNSPPPITCFGECNFAGILQENIKVEKTACVFTRSVFIASRKYEHPVMVYKLYLFFHLS